MEGATTGAVAAETEPQKTMNVLVAIDDSEESFKSLQWVIDNTLKQAGGVPTPEMAEQEGKVVTIVHVIEPLPHYAFPGAYVVESATRTQQEYAARILSRAYEMCRDNSLRAKTIVLEGDPKDKICQAVEEMKIDLLVLGSRGLGQIKRAFLGSVSDYCVHHAKCPVLVVKPPRVHH